MSDYIENLPCSRLCPVGGYSNSWLTTNYVRTVSGK